MLDCKKFIVLSGSLGDQEGVIWIELKLQEKALALMGVSAFCLKRLVILLFEIHGILIPPHNFAVNYIVGFV